MDKPGQEKSNTKYYVVGGAGIALTCFLVWLLVFSPYNILPKPTPVPVEKLSTVALFSNPDGEDKSNLIPVAYYEPTSTAEFEEWEDIINIAGNFLLQTTTLAKDLTFDLTGIPYAWLKFNPDGASATIPFETDWKLLYGEVNDDYKYSVYDTPDEVFFSMVNVSLAEYTGTAIDGVHTIIFDVNHTLADPIHIGVGWDMSTLAYAELSTTRQAEYKDEKYWTSLGNLYAPTDDGMTVYPRYELEYYTTCWAVNFTFDATVADATNDPISFVDPDTPAEIIVVADVVYVIFYDTITFANGLFTCGVDFDLTGATGVNLTSMDLGTIVVPRGAQHALGAWTPFP